MRGGVIMQNAPLNNLVNSDIRKNVFDKYYAKHLAKNASPLDAALLAYDDIKMDVKNGRIE